jgi:hypothetical protein
MKEKAVFLLYTDNLGVEKNINFVNKYIQTLINFNEKYR